MPLGHLSWTEIYTSILFFYQVLVCGILLVVMAVGNFVHTMETLVLKLRFKAKMKKAKSRQDRPHQNWQASSSLENKDADTASFVNPLTHINIFCLLVILSLFFFGNWPCNIEVDIPHNTVDETIFVRSWMRTEFGMYYICFCMKPLGSEIRWCVSEAVNWQRGSIQIMEQRLL